MPEEIVTTETITTYVVDDDAGIRMTIESLLTSLGHAVETFKSAEDFLSQRASQPGCLVLDVRLPETSGLQLQRILRDRNDRIPIVFISGYGDVSMAVQAIKAGATDFLVKPFREQDLLDAVQAALRIDRTRREEDFKFATYSERYRSLTEREREIMQHVVTGQMNKQIAASIGLSDVTVKIHRAQVMRKMGVNSLAELVRVADLVTPCGGVVATIR